jgi:hypothetical protein
MHLIASKFSRLYNFKSTSLHHDMEQMKEKNCDYRANAWKVFHSLQIRCGAQREAIEDLKKKDCSHLGEC